MHYNHLNINMGKNREKYGVTEEKEQVKHHCSIDKNEH